MSLLASVSRSFPIGAMMTLETGNAEVRFQPRSLEGVPTPMPTSEPKYLLLDGQQRTTSLYLALRSGAPVRTRDTRKNDVHRRYFADIDACIDPDADRNDAIVSLPGDKRRVNARGDVVLDVLSKKDTDGWEQWLTQLLIKHFGKPVTANVTVRFGTVNERTVARIDVSPASEPVYTLLTKTGTKGETFLVRINNTTHELTGSDAATYQHLRWAR